MSSTTPSRRPTPCTSSSAAAPTPELARGVYHGALKVFLDRFLNVPGRPSTRPPPRAAGARTSGTWTACWDQQGMIDEAGAIVYGWLAPAGRGQAVLAALGSALLHEDAEFHWFQMYEAAARQSPAWPEGSEQVGAHPGRGGPLPGRPHADPPRAAPGGAHRHPAASGRAALRVAAE